MTTSTARTETHQAATFGGQGGSQETLSANFVHNISRNLTNEPRLCFIDFNRSGFASAFTFIPFIHN